jgi:hypothetical protein
MSFAYSASSVLLADALSNWFENDIVRIGHGAALFYPVAGKGWLGRVY